MKTYNELIILIAEDDDGHAELIKEGLTESGVCNKMYRFKDGTEVWDFVMGVTNTDRKPQIQYKSKKSYLLLLDINMPKMDGIEVLKRMKAHEELKKIPVIMLTTTDDPREIEHCYTVGCNVYITKPVDFLKFTEILRRLGLFIQIVKT